MYTPISVTLPGFTITKWLTEEELEHPIYTDPAIALEEYREGRFHMGDKEVLEFVVNEAQRLFNAIVRKYFNTPDHLVSLSIKEEVSRLQHAEDVTGIPITKGIAFGGDPHVAISALYNTVQSLAQTVAKGRVEKANIGEPFSEQSFAEKDSLFNTILALQKQLSKLSALGLRAATLQGSFGSGDPLEGWSDLDLVLILGDEVFKNRTSLYTFKRQLRPLAYACYKVDPLAHHEFIYLTQLDVERSIPALFPVSLLSYGKCLVGKGVVTTTVVDSTYQHLHSLFKVAHYFRNKILSKKFSGTKYMWKNDLSHLFIAPSFALQALGIMVYKKESFERIKKELPEVDMSIVKEASILRTEWKAINPLSLYPNFLLFGAHPFITRIITSLVRRPLLKTHVGYSVEEVEAYTKRMRDFGEELFILVRSRLIP